MICSRFQHDAHCHKDSNTKHKLEEWGKAHEAHARPALCDDLDCSKHDQAGQAVLQEMMGDKGRASEGRPKSGDPFVKGQLHWVGERQ